MDNIKQTQYLLDGIVGESTSVIDTLKKQYLDESYNIPFWKGKDIFNDDSFIQTLKEEFSSTVKIDHTTATLVSRNIGSSIDTVVLGLQNKLKSSDFELSTFVYNEETIPIVETHLGNEPEYTYVIPAEILQNYINEHQSMNIDYCVSQLLEYHNIEPTNTYILLPKESLIENCEDLKELNSFSQMLNQALYLKETLNLNLCTE